ncbi:MAG TPA: hypothetical protein VIT45_02965 [Allosphingosinicella sp.]
MAVLLLCLVPAAPSAARELVVSPAPESVSVTVYRNPQRGSDPIDLQWLEGFALITEKRTITIPAGESEIRFVGVAGGILPQSAIVSGLPSGVGEKNRDARLLSPGALISASLGKRVHIRRTNPVTGAVTESEAVIRSGPQGIILQTAEGVEALRCTGLPETPFYDQVPAGLSDKATLAVTTSSAAPATVTVSLSYLASDFDWQAFYVVDVAPGAKTFDIFAWLTLANGNDESFVDAQTQAVAGTLNREEEDRQRAYAPQIDLRCWPQGRTHEIPLQSLPTAPPFAGAPTSYASDGQDIVVTGSRIRREMLTSTSPVTVLNAQQEELGDLKLYRIPEPVTVAAHAQKQVALLRKTGVPFDRLYAVAVRLNDEDEDPRPASILMRTKNVTKKHLGLPLPAGGLAVFEQAEGRRMLVGENGIADTAVGQDLEIYVGESPDIRATQRMIEEIDDEDDDWSRRRFEVEISNASPHAAKVEVELPLYDDVLIGKTSRKLGEKNGRRIWIVKVKPRSRARLTYLVTPAPEKPEPEDPDDD